MGRKFVFGILVILTLFINFYPFSQRDYIINSYALVFDLFLVFLCISKIRKNFEIRNFLFLFLLSLILWAIGDFIILFKTITNIPLKFVALEDIFYMFFPIPIFLIYSKIIKLKRLSFQALTISLGIISLIVLTMGILYPLIFLNPSTSLIERFVWTYYTITDWIMILLAVISLQSFNKNVEYKFLTSIFIFSLLYGLADIIFSMSALWLTPSENIVNSSLIYELSFFPLLWFLIN